METYDVAVIGAGASGCACCSRLVRLHKNLKIALIDRSDRIGRKLAVSGNGQGNVSNVDMGPSHYFGGFAPVCGDILRSFVPDEFFPMLFSSDDRGRIYPSGRQASSLCDCLLRTIAGGGVDIRLGVGAERVDTRGGFVVSLSDGCSIGADFLVLCVGGKAQRQFFTDGSSYSLALGFGHRLTPLYPSLVQLKTDMSDTRALKGIRSDCLVTALVDGSPVASSRGDVIFTDYGVSGNAIFSVSPYVTGRERASLSIEFLPGRDEDELGRAASRRREFGFLESEVLGGSLHNQVGRAVARRAAALGEPVERVAKNFTLDVTGTLGFDYAQVTRGGIDREGVSDRLESLYAENLFFAGEMLDIDGECGGYNLHWAFSSGIAVADEIGNRLCLGKRN